MQERSRVLSAIRCDNVTVSDEVVFVDEQTFNADGTACMGLIGADTDLGAESVTESVGKSCRCVPVNTCRIDFVQKTLGRFRVFGNDRIRVRGTIAMDMVD